MSAYFSWENVKKEEKKSEAQIFQRIRCYIVAKNEERNEIHKIGRSVSVNFAKKSLFTTFCFKAKINLSKTLTSYKR